jgi:predicted DNA-binding antitoxin AbrB/MazE fold protein
MSWGAPAFDHMPYRNGRRDAQACWAIVSSPSIEAKVMVYRGYVENGVIRLDDSVALPEGAKVRVEILPPTAARETEVTGLSLFERLKPLIGAAKDLPCRK